MTSPALEAYLRRLERELRQQGLQDRRIVDEAREHLVDAVEDGLQQGLSVEAAERQALVRFGSPEIVAAHLRDEAVSHVEVAALHSDQTRRADATRKRTRRLAIYHDVAELCIALSLRSSTEAAVTVTGFKGCRPMNSSGSLPRRGKPGEDVSAFETDPRERLVQFLREFGRGTFRVRAGRSNRSPCSKTRLIRTNGAADIWLHSPAGPR